jgi:broad specificity phosphatase PhoE
MEYESFHDVKIRIEKFIDWLKNEKYEDVLIVTHEICCQSARAIFEGISEEEAFSTPVGNCEFFEFEI